VLPQEHACAPNAWSLRARQSACICSSGGCMLGAEASEAGHACLRAWQSRARPNTHAVLPCLVFRAVTTPVNTGLKHEQVRQRVGHAWQTQSCGDALLVVAQHWRCKRRAAQLQAKFAKRSNRRAVAGCVCRVMARHWQAFSSRGAAIRAWGLICRGLGTRSQRPPACSAALCRCCWSGQSVQRRTP